MKRILITLAGLLASASLSAAPSNPFKNSTSYKPMTGFATCQIVGTDGGVAEISSYGGHGQIHLSVEGELDHRQDVFIGRDVTCSSYSGKCAEVISGYARQGSFHAATVEPFEMSDFFSFRMPHGKKTLIQKGEKVLFPTAELLVFTNELTEFAGSTRIQLDRCDGVGFFLD